MTVHPGHMIVRSVGRGHELVAIRMARFERDCDHMAAVRRQNAKMVRLVIKRTLAARIAERSATAFRRNIANRHCDRMLRVFVLRQARLECAAREMQTGGAL